MNARRPCLALLIFLLLLLSPTPLWAHSAHIHAWVEGDRVFTESFFSGGARAAHSQIEVFDEEGNKLLSGKTDGQGMFSFKSPHEGELRIVLRTPEGHGTEFHLEVEEESISEDHQRGGHTEEPPQIMGSPRMSKEEMRSLVEEVLDEKLEQMRKRLEASQKRGPGITEILGGIGYIIGLMGVAMYFSHRKKRKTNG